MEEFYKYLPYILIAVVAFIIGFILLLLYSRAVMKPVKETVTVKGGSKNADDQRAFSEGTYSSALIVHGGTSSGGNQGGSAAITRYDVFEHVGYMYGNPSRYPLMAGIKEKNVSIANMPDFLWCGPYCYGMVFGGDIVDFFILRMSDEAARYYGRFHPIQRLAFQHTQMKQLQHTNSVIGGNWYRLTMDNSYISKQEVFRIVDECYTYTLECVSRFNQRQTGRVVPRLGMGS